MLRGESPLSPSLDVRLGLRLTGNLHCRVRPSAYGSHSSVFLEGKVFENAAPGKTVQTRSRVRDSAQAHAGTHAIAQASRLRDGLGLVPGQRGACHQAAWSSRMLPQDTPSPKLAASLTPQTPLSRVRLVNIGWVLGVGPRCTPAPARLLVTSPRGSSRAPPRGRHRLLVFIRNNHKGLGSQRGWHLNLLHAVSTLPPRQPLAPVLVRRDLLNKVPVKLMTSWFDVQGLGTHR